jgi:NAD(P)-dependent dehydrogenase (short-subunit alcohol dehydrogenase family)
MRDNGIKGRMILVTSQHRETPRNLAHYSASKAGMTMVMKELARVLAPDGIRVNAIAPARPTTSPRSPSQFSRKDLAAIWWVRR